MKVFVYVQLPLNMCMSFEILILTDMSICNIFRESEQPTQYTKKLMDATQLYIM
jgi:hypothetical protein